MNFSCLIFDDEPSAIVEVSFLLGKHAPSWEILGVSSDIDTCRKLLSRETPDIVFCDIHFGRQIVFDALPELKAFAGNIVFITGDNSYATQAFELSAVNYLLKPIDEEKFIYFLSKYENSKGVNLGHFKSKILYHNLKENSSLLKKLSFPTSSGYEIRQLNEILYAKAYNNYSEFYFSDDKKSLATKTLLLYEGILEEFGFFRIHQSYLVNLTHIISLDTENLQIKLSNGHILPISNRKKGVLLDKIKSVF
jgi:two-component system LytT family response regulator